MTGRNQRCSDAAVQIRGLGRRFGDFVAVADMSLDVNRGEVFGFLGPNGAGKTTAIRMLCGILAPSTGYAVVAGFDIRHASEAIKQRIGYMSQRFSLYTDLTVEQNIRFFGGVYGLSGGRLRERIEWALELAGLHASRHRLTRELAVGFRQRLALACALLHEPAVLFLDEPTSGVDPIARRQFWDIIYRMRQRGATVFVTTHYMDEAEYCDRLGLMHRGELIAVGSPQELRGLVGDRLIFQVTCDRPNDALAAAEGLTGIREAVLFGGGVRLATDTDERLVEELRANLARAGIVVERVERVAPGLEDVFLWLIEAREREEAAEGRAA
jgi:ABC-2 type transport system ATP-binding protein